MKSLVLPSDDFWDFSVTKGGFITRRRAVLDAADCYRTRADT